MQIYTHPEKAVC